MKSKWPILIIIFFLACNSGKTEKNIDVSGSTNTSDSLAGNHFSVPVARNFWDSISMQLKISDEQMAKYTVLDSFDYKISRYYAESYADYLEGWGIWGDSVYGTRTFKVAVLRYSTLNCMRKYLLTFDSSGTHNLSYTTIEEGCDGDGDDSPYSFQEYKILTDSTFETTEIYDPGDADKTDRYFTMETTKWKIDSKGIVDSVHGKIRRREPKD